MHPIKEQPQDSAGTMILSKSQKLEANFSRAVADVSNAQAKKVNRFLPNPERYWGPNVRAGRTITSKHASLLGHEAANRVIRHEDGNGLVVDKPAPGTEEGVSATEEKSSCQTDV